MKLRMLMARGARYVAVQDLEQMIQDLAINEKNPKYRTKLYKLLEKIRKL